MRYLLISLIFLFSLPSVATVDSEIVNVKSLHSVTVTMDRLEAVLKENGMTIFTKIDHALGAKGIGTELRPTQLIVFGNPKIGTQLMQCKQGIAIDLPLKVLIFRDEAGQVWLSYNDPEYMAVRHKMNSCKNVVSKIKTTLGSFAKAATSK